MTEERPDDAHEPGQDARPDIGDDGLEARRESAPDAPFHGLRSAADIFGAPRGADDWPSRRERREAEKSARETGAPLPEPFEPIASGPEAPETPAPGEPPAPAAAPPADDDFATQAISMPEELTAPSQTPQANAEHERATLADRIPPAAPVAPSSTVAHPSSITLPTAQAHRDARAAEVRAIEDERRRLDPFGEGRSDVDWLGRATGSQATPTGPVVPPALGVENVLQSTDEPPSFTELLRFPDGAETPSAAGGHDRPFDDRPFDWAIRDDETGEVPTALTTDAFATTALHDGAWTIADDDVDRAVGSGNADVHGDDVETGAIDAPVSGQPFPPHDFPVPPAVPAAVAAAPAVPTSVVPTSAVSSPAGQESTAPAPAAEPADPEAATVAVPAIPAGQTPWWSEPEATAPPTAAPPLVEPAADGSGAPAYPAHLPPAVGQDLDAITGIRRTSDPAEHPKRADEPATLPAAAPDDLDQSEWDGRETSDTSAIKDLFGTEAVGQLGGTGYDPHDTGTQMMPAVAAGPMRTSASGQQPAAAVPRATAAASTTTNAGDRDNFINDGFAKLRNEGQRGKRLLVIGAVALIVVLLVAVFALTRWILGNTIEERTPAPTSTSAASAPASSAAKQSASAAPAAPSAASTSLATLQFATTPAAPGQHSWTELAGGECLSPFTNAWAQTYTVVDCSGPHVAQLTARLPVTADQWPGPDALATQAAEQCQTSAALDTAAAAAYGDVQVQGSYAPDQATWDQGDTFISCFVTRSSGATLTGSVAPDA